MTDDEKYIYFDLMRNQKKKRLLSLEHTPHNIGEAVNKQKNDFFDYARSINADADAPIDLNISSEVITK